MENYTYFDLLSHFGIGGAHPGGMQLTKELLSNEMINKDSVILDAGCGTGQTAAFLYQQFEAQICAIDINPVMIAKAKERFSAHKLPIQLINDSVENIPLKKDTFNFILSESVLAFVNKKKTLGEFHRLLKDGGRLIANEMTINNPLNTHDENEIKGFYGLDSLLLEDDWKKLLKEAGFKDIEIKKEKKSMLEYKEMPEFNFSNNFVPQLFHIMNQHAEIIIKFSDSLSFRTITCTKK